MSRSSGQFVTDRIEHHECHGQTVRRVFFPGADDEFTASWACHFAGNVDVTIDPETQAATWECPGCGTVHDIAWDDITGEDPDRERDE